MMRSLIAFGEICFQSAVKGDCMNLKKFKAKNHEDA
jgi:hypothetical protein